METWDRVEAFWNSNTHLARALLLIVAGITIWTLLKLPSPGIAIGLLATAAGIMSVRPPTMHIAERLIWVAVLVALLISEVHAIKKSDAGSSN
jgi:hypothetical protein